jgi:TPR repeat protein
MKINRLIVALIALFACAATAQAAPESETEWGKETLHRIYRSATEKENPEAMYLLGTMFDQGVEVPQSYKEAFKWYRRAADRGQAEAMNCLGMLYAMGDDVPQDYVEALSWYLKAVEHGSVDAMNNIAMLYYHGWGVRRSYADAAEWFQVAANRGDPRAMNSLGVMHDSGTGVTQSHATALKLFQRSAQQGYAPAMVNLGNMYASGEGVKKDNVQAYAWLSAALSVGVPEARDGVLFQLGMVAARLNAKQLARARRLTEGIPAAASAMADDCRAPVVPSPAMGVYSRAPRRDSCSQTLAVAQVSEPDNVGRVRLKGIERTPRSFCSAPAGRRTT